MKSMLSYGLWCALSLALLSSCGGSGDEGGTGAGGSTGSTQVAWEALPSEGAPLARHLHTAIWTGSRMIVWGGRVEGSPQVTATGGIYDPAAKSWTPTSSAGAPAARHSHTAVWTGSKMLVWGGYGSSGALNDGAVYDPASDTWAPMTTTGAPPARQSHTAVWTGTRMVVWGGLAAGQQLGTGGLYDPASDTWESVSTASAPKARLGHSAVWTGSRMIVWGGTDYLDWLQTGALFDPTGNTWVGMTASEGAPSRREVHTGVWAPSEKAMLIWGGWTGGPYEDTGALLGEDGSWRPMSVASAPSPRAEHVGIWVEDELFVWGGCGGDGCAEVFGDGARYRPNSAGGEWSTVETQSGLSARRGATGVFTGTQVIVWGGRDAKGALLDSGAATDI